MRMARGEELNRQWGVGASHALYREDGRWYHQLKKFPGALFDKSGYIVFETHDAYVIDLLVLHLTVWVCRGILLPCARAIDERRRPRRESSCGSRSSPFGAKAGRWSK